MDRIKIVGGPKLNGVIPISGAKNAALPLLITSLLTPDTLTLKNVPNLADVNMLMRILRNHGLDLTIDGKRAGRRTYLGETVHLTARDIVDTTAPYEMVSRMRASFWVLGPLLARCGHARVSMPGGCAIGTRPVDLHLQGLKALGADIEIDGGDVVASAPDGLIGDRVSFPKVSVGATINVLLAAGVPAIMRCKTCAGGIIYGQSAWHGIRKNSYQVIGCYSCICSYACNNSSTRERGPAGP